MNQIEIKLRSKILMMKEPLCVLMPEVPMDKSPADYYVPGKKYPVLWLLHGATQDYESCLQFDNLHQNLRGHEVIVVMPNGLNSDYANHMEFGTGYAFADFFFEELMPFIYSTFPASDDPKDNYIAGFSMGGAGALMLGLHHPERFGGIAPMGSSVRESDFLRPYLHLSGEQFRATAMADRTALPTEFGNPAEGITLKEINMIARYPTVQDYVDSMECTQERFFQVLESGNLPPIFFCCGDKDDCCPKVQQFVSYANGLGANQVSCEILPGCDHGDSEAATVHMIRHFGL